MNNQKILIIGPSWVGDMVMAQVLFKLLRQKQPNLHIDVLAPAWSIEVLQRMPEVNQAICLPLKHGEFGILARVKMARQLAKNNYSQAIVLTNSWKSALIPWLAKIPKRTGWLGEARWGLLNDVRYLQPKLLPRMVQRYAALALPRSAQLPNELPSPKLSSSSENIAAAVNKFALDLSKPILALCAGAAYGPAKRWPAEYYAAIAREKIAAGWQIWLFGSQQDEPVIESIRQQIPHPTTSFAGKLNLLETIDLLSTVQAVVTNDSGLLHIAASLDRPLVAIYGSTSPKFTPPLGQRATILTENLACSPCFKRECRFKHLNCMYQIKPEKVLTALANTEVSA